MSTVTETADRKSAARKDCLTAQGAADSWAWFHTPNATLAWDDKRLLITVETDIPAPEWAQVARQIHEVRPLTGDLATDDIGEPGFDRISRCWTWDLALSPALVSA